MPRPSIAPDLTGQVCESCAMDHPRIQVDPAIMVGKPCIKGTRITVQLILRKLASGDTLEDLVGDYPQITREDVRAALEYAADKMDFKSAEAAE